MNKEGQFFLIAALVVIAVMIGLAVVYNFVNTPPTDTKSEKLSNEIAFESGQLIKQGLYQGMSDQEINSNITALADIYSKSNPDSSIFLVYSTNSSIYLIEYNRTTSGKICATDSCSDIEKTELIKDRQVAEKKYKVTVDSVDYNFDLTEGKNFYLIIKRDKNDEKLVAT